MGDRSQEPHTLKDEETRGTVTLQSTSAFSEAEVEPCQESGWDYQSGLHKWRPGLQDSNREDKKEKYNKPQLSPGEGPRAEAETRKRGRRRFRQRRAGFSQGTASAGRPLSPTREAASNEPQGTTPRTATGAGASKTCLS